MSSIKVLETKGQACFQSFVQRVAMSTKAFTLVCFNAQTLQFSVSHLRCSLWPYSNAAAYRTSGALLMSQICSRVLSRSP